MKTKLVIQGRVVTAKDVIFIRSLINNNPSWNRTRLSKELCVIWEWHNDKGDLKDMSCRTLLRKLEQKGEIRLPVSQLSIPNSRRFGKILDIPHDISVIDTQLSTLQPLHIKSLNSRDKQIPLFKLLLQRYHYLGFRNCIGENLKYIIYSDQGRVLACMLFGSAAWKVKPRDSFIGWDVNKRQQNLRFLTNNTRFLIMPWVRVKHLASHVLARVCKMLSCHWVEKYGHPIHLLETFVEQKRFLGTCYKAAGWINVGETTGRSRNDTFATMSVPIKDIYLHPLSSDFKRRLSL